MGETPYAMGVAFQVPFGTIGVMASIGGKEPVELVLTEG